MAGGGIVPLRLSPVMWLVVGAALMGLAAARVPEKRNALRRLRAGLVAGFMGDCELEEAFRMGVASATARCMTEGYKIVDKTVYRALMDMIAIERI